MKQSKALHECSHDPQTLAPNSLCGRTASSRRTRDSWSYSAVNTVIQKAQSSLIKAAGGRRAQSLSPDQLLQHCVKPDYFFHQSWNIFNLQSLCTVYVRVLQALMSVWFLILVYFEIIFNYISFQLVPGRIFWCLFSFFVFINYNVDFSLFNYHCGGGLKSEVRFRKIWAGYNFKKLFVKAVNSVLQTSRLSKKSPISFIFVFYLNFPSSQTLLITFMFFSQKSSLYFS